MKTENINIEGNNDLNNIINNNDDYIDGFYADTELNNVCNEIGQDEQGQEQHKTIRDFGVDTFECCNKDNIKDFCENNNFDFDEAIKYIENELELSMYDDGRYYLSKEHYNRAMLYDYDVITFIGLDLYGLEMWAETHNIDFDMVEDYVINYLDLSYCDNCGALTRNDDLTGVGRYDESYVCERCLENYYTYCDHCEHYYNSDSDFNDVISHDYFGEETTQVWCERCCDRDAFYCEGSEQTYDNYYYDSICAEDTGNYYEEGWAADHLYYDDENNCYYEDNDEMPNEDESEKFDEVQGYHTRPDIHFYGEQDKRYNNKFGNYHHIGFELEVDKGANNDRMLKEIRELFDKDNNEIYGNYDGSLDSGFEIISQPHTLKSICKMPLKEMMKILIDNGYKSHDTTTCGLHFHFSRGLFGSTEKKQALAIRKVLQFFDIFYNEMIKVSRRDRSRALSWAKPSYLTGDENTKDKRVLNSLKEHCKNIANKKEWTDRYHAVNTTNYATIEFRLARGTLRYETFMATLDLYYRIILNAKTIKDKEITNPYMWLKGIKETTRDYIKSRGAFLDIIDNVKTTK